MARARLIYTDIPGDLPAEYVVPPDSELEISSVYARINGAGAASSFRPCLSVFSQSGNLIARVPLDETYAVADTGDATWSPFLKTAAAASPAGAASWAYIERQSDLTVVTATPTYVVPSMANVSRSSSAGTALTVTDGLFGGGVTAGFAINETGLYVVGVHTEWTTSFAAYKDTGLSVQAGSLIGGPGGTIFPTTYVSESVASVHGAAAFYVVSLAGSNNDAIYCRITQQSGVNRVLTNWGMVAFKFA